MEEAQNEEIKNQNQEIQAQGEEIREINENLENLVRSHTAELERKTRPLKNMPLSMHTNYAALLQAYSD